MSKRGPIVIHVSYSILRELERLSPLARQLYHCAAAHGQRDGNGWRAVQASAYRFRRWLEDEWGVSPPPSRICETAVLLSHLGLADAEWEQRARRRELVEFRVRVV